MNPIWEIIRGLGFHPLKQLHALIYGKFTPRYLWAKDKLSAHLPQKAKDYLADTYHGKVMKLEDAIEFVSSHHDMKAHDLEKVIPYKYARDLILKNPDHIVAYRCACRSLKKDHCEPSDVCLIIGEPFAGLAVLMQPAKSRKISSDEAISILKAEDERGHVHTAYFKDIMLDRFYAICNCCKCCCLQMKAYKEHGVPMLASSGHVSQVSEDCDGCGICAESCPFDAIVVEEKARVVYEKCMGCGICEPKCPIGAISLMRDAGKGEPLDIKVLRQVSGNQLFVG
ncbi:4Fe-4S binding protein [Chloroflexota bacterium]